MTFTQPDSSLPEKSLAPSELTIPLDYFSLHLNHEFSRLEFKCRFHKETYEKTTHLLEKLAFTDNSSPDAPPSRAKKRCKKRIIVSRS